MPDGGVFELRVRENVAGVDRVVVCLRSAGAGDRIGAEPDSELVVAHAALLEHLAVKNLERPHDGLPPGPLRLEGDHTAFGVELLVVQAEAAVATLDALGLEEARYDGVDVAAVAVCHLPRPVPVLELLDHDGARVPLGPGDVHLYPRLA